MARLNAGQCDYNDHYGHPAGDACLARVAQTLSQTICRADDLLARYGGEEFAAVLAGSDLTEATALAEKARAAVLDLAIPHAHSSATDRVSLSIGVASLQPGLDAAPSAPGVSGQADATGPSGFELSRVLFERADQALYAAKSGGRNRVAVADDEHGSCCKV